MKWSKREAKRNDAMFARMYRYEASRKQGNRCCYCFEPTKPQHATADHVVPRSRGGTTTAENISAACAPCNLAKASLSKSDFEALLLSETLPPGLSVRRMLAWARSHLWRRQYRAEQTIKIAAGIA